MTGWWRTVAHLVRTDLRRIWPVALLCILLATMEIWLREWDARRPLDDLGHIRPEVPPGILLTLTQAMLAWVVTALVVLGDPPRSGQAFWRTRPIAWTTLLSSKLLVLSLPLVIWPTLLHGGWLATYRAPPASIAITSGQVVATELTWMLTAFLFAALAGSIMRFAVLALGAGVVALWNLPALAQGVLLSLIGASGTSFALWNWWGRAAPTLTGSLVAIGAMVAVVGLLYGSRRLVAASTLAAGLLCVPFDAIGMAVWSAEHAPALALRDEVLASINRGRARVVVITPIGNDREERGPASPTAWTHASALFDVAALPHDSSAEVVRLRSSLDGTRASERRHVPALLDVSIATARAAGLDPCHGQTPASRDTRWKPTCDRVLAAPLLNGTFGELSRYRGRAVSPSAELWIGLATHREVAALAMQPGTTWRTPDYLLEVLRIHQAADGPRLLLRMTRFVSLHEGGPLVSLFVRSRQRRQGRAIWLGRTSILPTPSEVTYFDPHAPAPVAWGAGVQTLLTGELSHDRLDRAASPSELQWLADARLVVVESRYAGTLTAQWNANDVVVTGDVP